MLFLPKNYFARKNFIQFYGIFLKYLFYYFFLENQKILKSQVRLLSMILATPNCSLLLFLKGKTKMKLNEYFAYNFDDGKTTMFMFI